MLKKLFQSFRPPVPGPHHRRTTPEVINKSQHSLQRHQFSRHAVNIVERLQSAGYQAYLVGGCVRDLMLGITPKDFDVATSATPNRSVPSSATPASLVVASNWSMCISAVRSLKSPPSAPTT